MKLVACDAPQGFLESAPLSPLCDAIVTTSGAEGALAAVDAFWCWDDDRYYVRRVVRQASAPAESAAAEPMWYSISDTPSGDALADDVLTPRSRQARGKRPPAFRVRVGRGRAVAAMAMTHGNTQRRPR